MEDIELGAMPIINPIVITVHARRILRDGYDLRKKGEARTVKGRTRPRATW